MGYKQIAMPLAERGIPTIPLRPRSKIAFLSEWETKATTDISQIERWDKEYPDANAACVAYGKPGSIWFLEIDKPEVVHRIESQTGEKIPRTFRVRSSPGRGHFYWKQTAASLAMNNIAQGFVANGDWSARVDRQYVVAPGSLHPTTGTPYEIVSLAEIVEAPDWLVKWCVSQKVEKKFKASTTEGEPIPEGGRNNTLTSIAGRLRSINVNHDEIEAVLLRMNGELCQPPLPEDEVKTIAASISRYAPGPINNVLIGGRLPGSAREVRTEPSAIVVEEDEEDKIILAPTPYPKFPNWVMEGTSINEGLVKPFCDANCRYGEFMFMPAMVLLLNYVGTRVRIKQNNIIPSIYLALIGRKGRVIKSSSVQDAIAYFQYAGMADHGNANLNNAEGKTLIWSVGSPEGLGIEMARINCKNGVLFYDELAMLTSKAGIDSSALLANLLLLYESGNFQNLIKSKKENYSLAPGTYCASMIVCSTDKSFTAHWSKLSGKSSGLDDRFFFLYQREQFLELSPYAYVSTQDGAVKTRQLVDKAVDQKVFSITDASPLAYSMAELGNRAEIRAEKFALGFAIDLGREQIDEDCIERGLALVKYERAVKKYIKPFEGATREATIQLEIQNLLQRYPAGLDVREIYRMMHPERFGTTLWKQVYSGMLASRWMEERGTGKRGDPKKVYLLWVPEDEDE